MQRVRLQRVELLADVDEIAEVPPFHELHRKEMLSVGFTDVVDRDDVFVLERFAQFGLTVEFGDRLRVF